MDQAMVMITKLKAAREDVKRIMKVNDQTLEKTKKTQEDLKKMLKSLNQLLKNLGH